MFDAVGLRDLATPTEEAASVKSLDEGLWRTWEAKARAQGREERPTRSTVLKCGLVVAFLAVAGLWSHLAPYDTAIRWILAVAAGGMMFAAFHQRHYEFGAAFAGLVLLYNPVSPVFGFSGNWQRALVVASAIPFVTSLAWRDRKAVHID